MKKLFQITICTKYCCAGHHKTFRRPLLTLKMKLWWNKHKDCCCT